MSKKSKAKTLLEEAKITRTEFVRPLLILFRDEEDRCICRIHPPEGSGYGEYAILIADVIHHVAKCFEVDPMKVVEMVHMELKNPTDKIEGQIFNG